MKTNRVIGLGLVLFLSGLQVQGAIYDDFNNNSGTWAYSSGTSPNGKWTYGYGNNPDWASMVESGGYLNIPSVREPGDFVKSTQTWTMPAHPNESLTFTLAVTNFFFNGESGFQTHNISIIGDKTTFGVYSTWNNNHWFLNDESVVDTGVAYPTNGTWDTVTIKFLRDATNYPYYSVTIDREGSTVYSSGNRNLFPEYGSRWAQNTTAQLQLSSTFARARYDYVDVTFVPEPATMILLGLGGLLLRRKVA